LDRQNLMSISNGPKRILFVADPLSSFKTYKDSTYSMMVEAARRGHEVWACEQGQLFIAPGKAGQKAQTW
jgi:glutathione synthase/RimK-type ligase-like ATP-grasp enzyme